MIYVNDVSASLAFYESVLQITRHHEDDDGSYGELHHGDTSLGFVANWHAERNLGIPFRRNEAAREPGGFELYFVVENVDAAYDRALGAGGIAVSPPTAKPWGNRAAIIRDIDGLLVELADEGEAKA
jgi:catechol 2,3-dioxygenase-like lactoylglutathione lyase family enzyme